MDRAACLYYPSVVPTRAFLSRALLFWDRIYTIMPEEIGSLRGHKELDPLFEDGTLQPITISSGDEIVQVIEKSALRYALSIPGQTVLFDHDRAPKERADDDFEWTPMYPEKLTWELRSQLEEMGLLRRAERVDEVERGFASFYMTLLASEISNHAAVVPVSDDPLSHQFALDVRAGNARVTPPSSNQSSVDVNDAVLVASLLSTMTIEISRVDESVPLSMICDFRQQHKGDIGSLRSAILQLAHEAAQGEDQGDIAERTRAIFQNKVQPQMAALEDSLKSSRIRTLTDTMQVVTFGGGSVALAPLLGPFAVLAGAGISLVVAAIRCSNDRKDALTRNPYGVLLSAQRELTS